jgi:membrane-bound metal-dependent hydrolase YbcI (DUF457 family)
MSFPPAHALIGAGLAEVAIAAKPLPRWRAWTLAAFLAVSPDFDIVFGLLVGRGASMHGTFSHSITATAIMALAFFAIGGARWALVAAVGYGSHLLVDMLDDSGPTNLELGWPFTPAQPYAIGPLFPKVPFEHGQGMRGAIFSLLEPAVFAKLAAQTGLAFAIFLGLLGVAHLVRRARGVTPPGAAR